MMQNRENAHPGQRGSVGQLVRSHMHQQVVRMGRSSKSKLTKEQRSLLDDKKRDIIESLFVPIELRHERAYITPRRSDLYRRIVPDEFRIRDLPLPFSTPPNIVLPPVDDYG